MKSEKLRVLAAIFGVPYDDLRQRQRERKMRRIVTASLLVGAACLLFGVYGTMTALRIKEQKEQIEVQAEQILEQSKEIQAKSDEIQKQNVEITKQNEELALRQAKSLAELATAYFDEGDNKTAIQLAVEALTESDGIMLPYTPEAQYILTDSLRAYDTGTVFRAGYQYEISGRILNITVSPDGRVLAITDANGEFYLFDLESRTEIANLTKEMNEQKGNHTYTFLAGNQIAFIGNNCIKIYDMQKKEIINEIEHNSVCRIFADKDGKYLCAEDLDFKYTIYDSATLECINIIDKPTDKGTESSAVAFTEGVLVDACYDRDEQGNKLYTLYCWDIESGQLISQCYMGLKQLTDIQLRDGVLYTMNAVYAEGFVNCDTYITAISMESGEILWEKFLQGEYARRVKLPAWTEGTHLFTATGKKIRILDLQTGENAFEMELSSDILEVYSYADNNNFLFLLQNGQLSVISIADNLLKTFIKLPPYKHLNIILEKHKVLH